jgi:hypothetical protein
MPELYVAEVDYEEAGRLADLASIYQDLSFTINVLRRLIQLLKDGSKDDTLIQSFWTAALISYVRCFSSGKRFGLSKNIFEKLASDLEGGGIAAHQYFKDLRDKHIAHSVNPFEQIKVGLVLSEPSNPRQEVLGVSTLSQKLICVGVETVESLLKMALIAHKQVAIFAKEYECKTLEVGRTLPIDVLYSKPRLRIVTPAPEDAARARKCQNSAQ